MKVYTYLTDHAKSPYYARSSKYHVSNLEETVSPALNATAVANAERNNRFEQIAAANQEETGETQVEKTPTNEPPLAQTGRTRLAQRRIDEAAEAARLAAPPQTRRIQNKHTRMD